MRVLLTAIMAFGSMTVASPEEAGAQGGSFSCVVEGVRDGASFYCRDGRPVVLHGIDVPAIGLCRGGNCPGLQSRRALHRMITGRNILCRRTGMTYGRIIAWCHAGDADVGCRLLRGGFAARRARVDQATLVCSDE